MNKYIYIKETGQVAGGPLPKGFNIANLREDFKMDVLPRIDIVGEHSFLDGQILDLKDILVIDTDKWYYAKCEECGYENSSEHFLSSQIADTGDSDIGCPKCFSNHVDETGECPSYVGVIAIPLKQVQKEKDFEPEVHAINKASLEEAAISHLETLYIKDYVRQRLKEPDWPLGWHQILRAFEKGAEWAASQEVKGNATQQGLINTNRIYQSPTGALISENDFQYYPDSLKAQCKLWQPLPEKPNSSTSPEWSVAENVAQGIEPMANNSLPILKEGDETEEDMLAVIRYCAEMELSLEDGEIWKDAYMNGTKFTAKEILTNFLKQQKGV